MGQLQVINNRSKHAQYPTKEIEPRLEHGTSRSDIMLKFLHALKVLNF